MPDIHICFRIYARISKQSQRTIMKLEKEQTAPSFSSTTQHTALSSALPSLLLSKLDISFPQPENSRVSQLPFFTKASSSRREGRARNATKINATAPKVKPKSKGTASPPLDQSDGRRDSQLQGNDPQHNTPPPAAKGHKRPLNVNRSYAAYARRDTMHAKRKKVTAEQENNHFRKFQQSNLILPIFPFNPKTAINPTDEPFQTAGKGIVLACECLREGLLEGMEGVDVQLGERSPKTPKPDLKSQAVLRRRIEETPFKKCTIGIPEYVFNSDDEVIN
eukprot:TRINITY_DN9577_c0_g1_i1.p1 TRINITY_DN9577_c0_g1~~TRINITY_DN9577_c0_g1_i1.p1  ORF type:complete len:278 (-),score=17.67 TRINITY_DN9577_c0_g1_i1:209-1042(-)